MISLLLILISSAFFPGIIAIVKAKASGRKGPDVFQPLRDIARLLKKGSVYSTTSSIIFQTAPAIYFMSIVGALLTIPFEGKESGFISFEGDFLFFAYLLALGKFMMIVAALDTGSGFEGMGANREALYSMLVEPVFFILLASFALLTGHTSFYDIFANFHFDGVAAYLYATMAVYLLVQVAMIENSRLPVDDPRTHLELTMVHEVMVLDNSGFDLGLIQTGNALKFGIYGALIANFIIPPEWSFELSLVLFPVIQFVFAVTVGLLESFRARMKMAYNTQFILSLSAIGVVAFFTVFIITNMLK